MTTIRARYYVDLQIPNGADPAPIAQHFAFLIRDSQAFNDFPHTDAPEDVVEPLRIGFIDVSDWTDETP